MTSQNQSQAQQLVWLITGTSSGIGHDLAQHALSRGDKVIATSRAKSVNTEAMKELKKQGAAILELDVTASLDLLKVVAREAVAIYGRVDVLVNNAGYVLFGALEENSPQETFDQFNTNLFGALNVTRAFLPYMRERKTGTIVWIGSMYGLAPCVYASAYVGTKWAMRGMSMTLDLEIEPLGLRSIVVDFGYFRTSVLAPERRVTNKTTIEDYKPIADKIGGLAKESHGKQRGDPKKGVQAIVDVVRGEGKAAGKPFPKELLLGSDCYEEAKKEAEKHSELLEAWKDVSFSTDFPPDM